MRILLPTVLWCVAVSVALAPQSNAASSAPLGPCAALEQKQLAFWVGEWDLTWPGAKPGELDHGTNSVHRLLENCLVQENFSGGHAMHLRGMSVSIFDTRAGRWKQTWVDNQGGYLDFVGEFKDGQLILGRDAVLPDGTGVIQGVVFKNITAKEFDWNWEASTDGGKSWQVRWPIHYSRKAPRASPVAVVRP